MDRTIKNFEYGHFLHGLKEYELEYLDYLRDKEKRRMHWVRFF